jgi:cell division septal protein FtsQ
MEIKTNRPRDNRNAGFVPPPDRARRRKKTQQKLGKGPIGGRHYVSALKASMRFGAFLAIGAFMVSICFYAYTSERFHLDNIVFYGCKHVDPEQLAKIIRQDFPANILRIDLRKLKSRLEEETWVRRVEISRVLPSDLIVYVYERIPSVILEIHNELLVADRDGIALGRYDPKFGNLDVPVFRGLLGKDAQDYGLYQEENSARIRQALDMLSEIESGSPQFAKRISEIDISDRKNLKILFVDDTAEIYLGRKDYWKRLNAFLSHPEVFQRLKDQYEELEYIDLRFDSQFVFKPRRSENFSMNSRSPKPDLKAGR